MGVEVYAGCLERVILGERGEAMQDLGYGLPRIHLPRTPVNKSKTQAETYRLRPPFSPTCLGDIMGDGISRVSRER
jgi:hypothetical protein